MLTYNVLMSMVEAHTDVGEALEPNGVVEALAVFYVQVYRAAKWDDEYIVDHIGDLVEGIIYGGEGHSGPDAET